MNFSLVRKTFEADGILSVMIDENGIQRFSCIEHAYFENGAYAPKLPNGTYTCVRGTHRLEGMNHDFESFEVTGVPGHTGILFHIGNFNRDSSGCILLGEAFSELNEIAMVTKSVDAFEEFMQMQTGVDRFQLTVS